MLLKTLAYIATGILLIIVVLFVVKMVNGADHITFTEEPVPGVPSINKNDAIYGNPSSPNQIFLFGYAECDNCEEMQTVVVGMIEDGTDAMLVWEDFPNTSLAPESLASAIAMRCAQEQDAFWEYQSFLFDSPRLGQETYLAIAAELELKQGKFERCLKNGTGAEQVQASIEEGNTLGITATPTIFINGERFTGLITEREITSLLMGS